MVFKIIFQSNSDQIATTIPTERTMDISTLSLQMMREFLRVVSPSKEILATSGELYFASAILRKRCPAN